MSVFYNLHKVKQLLSVKNFHTEVVQYKQISLCQPGEETMQGTGYAGKAYFLEEPVQVIIGNLISVHAGLMTKRCTQPAFTCTGSSRNKYGHPVFHIVTSGKIKHFLLVYATLAVIDNFTYGSVITEVCFFYQTGAIPGILRFLRALIISSIVIGFEC